MILVGCSGWSYAEWNSNFYPKSARDEVKYYSEVFDTVEVNSTFYREFDSNTLKSWITRVRSNPRFRFTLKIPQKISHEEMFLNMSNAISDLSRFIESEVAIFQSAGVLGVLLLQLPPRFSRDDPEHLLELMSSVDSIKYKFFVEFRSRDLYNDMDLRRKLNSINVGVVHIDSPDIHLDEFHQDEFKELYYRFHGRNIKDWFSTVQDSQSKYNYSYSNTELEALSSIVKKSTELKDEIFVYFNNHPNGSAPINAMGMLRLLGFETKFGGGRLAV